MMLGLIKQVVIESLCSSRSLATASVSLNNEPWMIKSTLIDLNPIKHNYYSFMVSLDKCSESRNPADDLSTEMNVKVSNMITRINEAKTILKYI